MVKYKNFIFASLIIFFLIFSFYPTIFELQRKDNLADSRREFILEHNYYWPDYNLYLSKIRQGLEDRFTAVEKYTSEIHKGSLIQEFYVVLGWAGRVFNLTPNDSYLLGRIILSPLLLLIIILLVKQYFKSLVWQVLAFIITVTSASCPRFFSDSQGITHIGRYMEWWSNIDALQRITFIPHILFGQVVSFYLLYQLTMKSRHSGIHDTVFVHSSQTVSGQWSNETMKKLILLIFLGNLAGLAFPPSLITLDTVLLLMILIKLFKKISNFKFQISNSIGLLDYWFIGLLVFILSTLPSLLYIFFITKRLPWSALVDFHRTHPMMIPFDQYILGTGPVFFLGIAGAIVSIIKRDKKFQPLIFWILATFSFAAIFSIIKDQSPLRFTQTGLFIPLGILGSYLFYQIYQGLSLHSARRVLAKYYEPAIAAFIIILSFYILGSLFMMKTSLDWQTTWITQRIGANIPLVPYPPQAMYPLREWMDGIRWLKNNTKSDDVVLAEITAANHIPAYSGNTVYWGQSNTVDYDRKEKEVDSFFAGSMTPTQAELFLKNGRIKFIFFSIQEKDLSVQAGKSGSKELSDFYQMIKPVFRNPSVTIYQINSK